MSVGKLEARGEVDGLLPSEASKSRGVAEGSIVHAPGDQLNGDSNSPAISGDGRYVAFDSFASDVVSGDTNELPDVFVHDTRDASTVRVSVSSDGTQANAASRLPAISSDGRYVAFLSWATNLAGVVVGEESRTYLHDRATRRTTLVGDASDDGLLPPAISADGRYVAYGAEGGWIALYDGATGITTRVTPEPAAPQTGISYAPSISGDGRYVAYVWQEDEIGLVPDPCGGVGNTEKCMLILVYDRLKGTSENSAVHFFGSGSYYSYTAATSISADGRWFAHEAQESGCIKVYVLDRSTGRRVRADPRRGDSELCDVSFAPSISADGRFAAFWSFADDLVSNDVGEGCSDGPSDRYNCPDVFVRDLVREQTTMVSVARSGAPRNGWSREPSISRDGRYVAFMSKASNLVPADTNGAFDVFVRDLLTGTTSRVSVSE